MPAGADDRSWLVPVTLVSIVALALGLAWMLIGGTEARRDLFDLVDRVAPGGPTASAEPVTGLIPTAFDPGGDGGEGNDEVGLAVDGDPATAWTTETYKTRALGGLKPGVGLIVDLGEARDVEEVVVESPSGGWAGSIFVAESPGEAVADWGEPAAAVTDADAGTTTIDIDGRRGGHVLLWITDLGTEGGYEFRLQELQVRAS